MEVRPEDHVEVLLKGYKAGVISRRRIMALAAKLPALAAALGVGAHLRSASAAGGGSARRAVTRMQEGSTVTMAYATTVGDTLNQHRSNFTVSRMIARHVLENLTWVNPADGSVNPWLAESWEISPDGMVYTFKLKQGVTFHDGTPFNAEAVKANFDDTMDPNKRSGFAFQALGGDAYTSTEVVDEHTVKVTFNKPHATFLLYLSDGGTGIDSPTALAAGGEDYGTTSLVGSGPYKFVEWIVDDHVTLEAVPDYSGGPAAFGVTGASPIQTLNFRDVPEPSVRAQAVIANEIQIARIVEPNVPEVEGQEGVTIIATPKAGSTRMYLMNTTKAPLDDINVRKAINMAIDKQAMLSLPGWAGYGRPGIAPMPSNMVPDGDLSSLMQYDIPFDLEGANALLEENGYVMNGDVREKDGVKLIFDMLTPQTSVDEGQIEPIDGFLREAGMQLNIKAGDTNFWIDGFQNGDYHLTLMSDSGYIAVGIIEEFFRAGEPFATTGLDNPEVNRLIDEATAAPTLEEQWAALMPAMGLIMQEVVGVMAWEQDYLDVARTELQNIAYNEVGFPWFYGASLGA